MRVLVTGGAGYIGSVVAQELIRTGKSVIVYDNLSRGYRAATPSEALFIEGDLADQEQLNWLFEEHDIDTVMHFAGFIQAAESMIKPVLYFRNNVSNSLNLLEAMTVRGVRKLVFSSTAGVYGEPERIPIEETDRLAPTNFYSESKLIIERLLQWFHRLYGLRYASLRYFNASGATDLLGEDHRPETHLIPLALEVALGYRDHLDVYGTDYSTPDGTCIRDYIHVLDLASAHLLALDALDEADELVYNLGIGRGFSVYEVVDIVRQVTGHPIPVVKCPRRPGDSAVLVASYKKIKKELGWQPCFVDLEAIVASAWRWRKNHPLGYAG